MRLVLLVEVDQCDVGEAEHALDHLLRHFALGVHEDPFVPTLVALVEEDVDLPIGKDVLVGDIED